MALGLIGEVFALGIALDMMKNINGKPHKLVRKHKTKSSAETQAKVLRKKGKKVKVLEGKDKNGKPTYGVYVKVEEKKKKKIKP